MDLKITKLGVALGAEIGGIDARKPLPLDVAAQLRAALYEHQVLVLRDQDGLSEEEQFVFAKIFGFPAMSEPYRTLALLDGHEVEPGNPQVRAPGVKPVTQRWHADVTFAPRPPLAGTLFARIIPKVGGDTAFVSLGAIYDALSEPMQRLCEQVQAVHSIRQMEKEGHVLGERILQLFPDTLKPLVLAHPETGRKTVQIQSPAFWITGLQGIHEEEADFLLRYLRSQLDNIEFQFRWKWRPGDLLIWDQRSVVHMGLKDHFKDDPVRELYSIWAYPDDQPQYAA